MIVDFKDTRDRTVASIDWDTQFKKRINMDELVAVIKKLVEDVSQLKDEIKIIKNNSPKEEEYHTCDHDYKGGFLWLGLNNYCKKCGAKDW